LLVNVLLIKYFMHDVMARRRAVREAVIWVK